MKKFYMNLPQNMEDFEQQMELFKAKGFTIVEEDGEIVAKKGNKIIVLV